jgi:hypothetical protein
MYNHMNLPYLGVNISLLLTDLSLIRIQIRIQNYYFASGSDSDLTKNFLSFRIRIHNPALFPNLSLYSSQIRIVTLRVQSFAAKYVQIDHVSFNLKKNIHIHGTMPIFANVNQPLCDAMICSKTPRL